MKVFYFTATGNSLFVAKKLSKEIYSIPQILKADKFDFQDEKIGIVFPNYYIGIPKIVAEFIEKVNLKADYIFAIITYGKFSGNAVYNFSKYAEKNGIKINFADEILMIDNYLPGFDMAKQKAKKSDKKINKSFNNLVNRIENNENFILKKNFLHSILSNLAQNFYKKQKGDFDKKFYVEDSCNSCGICEQVCPFGNISINKKPVFKHKCEQCLACINLCPQNAIHLKKEKSRERFINSNVNVAEIIKSNQVK